MSDCVLAEMTHAAVRSGQWEAAVLPFGATEPHNLHMPYGTDNYQVDIIGRKATEYAFQRGAKVLLLPTVPFGVNTNFLNITGAVACSVTPTTLLRILTDLVESMERQGIRKLVLLNGHGGNELKPLMRELHHRSKVFLCLCDWFRMAKDFYPTIFEQPGEHADEVETSLGLAFFPELVHLQQADAGQENPTRLDAINRGWIGITRPWHLATTNTGMGDPRSATAEKGRRLMDAVVNRLGQFLVDLANLPMSEAFPYQ
jgi:creatinine amidohydrolase